jgi:hypothetical protein
MMKENLLHSIALCYNRKALNTETDAMLKINKVHKLAYKKIHENTRNTFNVRHGETPEATVMHTNFILLYIVGNQKNRHYDP